MAHFPNIKLSWNNYPISADDQTKSIASDGDGPDGLEQREATFPEGLSHTVLQSSMLIMVRNRVATRIA